MSSSLPVSTLEKFSTFGDLLRFLRRRAGITQMDLATAVGYSDAQISRLEQNLRLPDIPTIEARFVPALGLEQEPRAVARLLELAASVRREDAPVFGLCPYKGLNYFDETDADLFVGREALTAKLTERVISLTSGQLPGKKRFLAVVGASGSGKSSLVRAGLVPSLRWNKASADWNIQVLTPTAQPLESLAMSLTRESGSVSEAARLMDDFVLDPRSLHLYARREMKSADGSRLLLVIDQFEELFALCRSEQEKIAFIDNLLMAAEAKGPIMAVITLRADFYAHCAGYIQLREALAWQQEYIGAMTNEELRRAIEEPARRGRWEIESGLVDLLLHDVGHEPGALPLLSHALLETWQRRRGRTMTLSGYTSSGGVRGAIAETAEAVFADQFTPEQKAIARRIFLRLTELGDETTTGDTRRRATYSELILKPEEKDMTQNVLKALADARLITTSETSAEVAHEALIREWPTLRGWLEDNREGLRLHRHLTEATQDWLTRKREADVLYRGARLYQACEWAASHPDELNAFEHEFLQASQKLAEQEASEREAQRQRELEAAQKLAEAEQKRAEEQSRSAAQLRKRAIYLAGAFLVAVVMAIVAGLLGWQARTTSLLASSRELAAAAISNLEIDPERSILLALEAVSKAHTLEAEQALHQSIMTSRLRLTIPAHEPGAGVNVVYSPDGSRIASASADETVKVWDTASGKLLFTVAGHAVSYRPDGRHLATVLANGTVKLWDATTGKETPLTGPINASGNVVFSPDGTRLATVAGENLPRVWDVSTAEELVSFPGHTDYVSYVFYSPDGRRLLTTSDDRTARVWDVATGEPLLKLADHPSWVWTAAFSPDGKRIATVSENETFLWDAANGKKLLTVDSQGSMVYVVAFSPECANGPGAAADPCGMRLATGGADRKVVVWDAHTGKELFSLSGHTGTISSIAFNPDGTRLATGSDDGTLKIWDLTPNRELLTIPAGAINQVAFSPDCISITGARVEQCGVRLAGGGEQKAMSWDAFTGKQLQSFIDQENTVSVLAFHPNGKLLVTAGDDMHMELWDTASGAELYKWQAHTGLVNALVFEPTGTRLVSASDDYKVKVWEFSTGADGKAGTLHLSSVLELPTEVKSVALSPDGTTLATGAKDGTTKLWDFAKRQELFTLAGHSDAVISVAFSPDGKRLATASLDGTAKTWEAGTGNELFKLSGHNNAVMAVAYSPDGKRIATASRDGTAKLWDAKTGEELLTLFGDGSGLNSITYSPDGTRLATGGEAGVRVYLMDLSDLVGLARTRVTRTLTSEECQKYLHRISTSCASRLTNPTPTAFPPALNGRVCQVASDGSVYDNYFNAQVYKGLQDSAEIYNLQATVLQAMSASDYEKTIRRLLSADCHLIVPQVPLFEATLSAARANPDQKFMMMDFVYDPTVDNIWNQVYATDQGAFLAGYLAASVTRTGKVGVFGGIDIPQVTDFMDGFVLGVDYYNLKNDAKVEVLGWDVVKHEGLFSGGFCCSTEGRRMARRLLDQGADIILPVAGKSVGWGALVEVKDDGNAWFIGVDTDWAITDPGYANIVLTSIEKRFDVSVVQVVRSIKEGTFTGGIHVGSLATGEVGLSPYHDLELLVPSQIKADLEQIKADIIAGKIKTRP